MLNWNLIVGLLGALAFYAAWPYITNCLSNLAANGGCF